MRFLFNVEFYTATKSCHLAKKCWWQIGKKSAITVLSKRRVVTMHFSQKLKWLRAQHHLTQEQLAKILFVSRQAISKYESGRGYPDVEKIVLLSKLFNVSMDFLLDDEMYDTGKSVIEDVKVDKVKRLFSVLSKHFGISEQDIVGQKKDDYTVDVRRIAMYLCYNIFDMSLTEISAVMGKRENTAILHGIQSIERKIGENCSFNKEINLLGKKIMMNT